MRTTRAAAATAASAALEGPMCSPDTQECREMFCRQLGLDFEPSDSGSAINKPCASPERLSFPLNHFDVQKPLASIPEQQASQRSIGDAVRGSQNPSSKITDEQIALVEYQSPPWERADLDVQAGSVKSALRRDSRGRLRLVRLDGTEVHSHLHPRKMEDFMSPLYGSDGSNMSTTQENDPSVYARLLAEGTIGNSPSSGHTRGQATQDPIFNTDPGTTVTDTGRSYAADDTGHLTLDYQPPPPIQAHDSINEAEMVDVSHVHLGPGTSPKGNFDPRTPSQPKLVLDRPGTVLRLSQMFTETQPSPGSRNRQAVLPSSSRPSPDLFHQSRTSKNVTSSPLIRRGDNGQSLHPGGIDLASSPPNSLQIHDANRLADNYRQRPDRPRSVSNEDNEVYVPASILRQDLHVPFDNYTSRKESQERRRLQVNAFHDESQYSDDGFSDEEALMSRRAKLKKEEAAKELANIRASRPGSAGNDIVEVPSTSNGCRRSLIEDYGTQYSSPDARDTQPDDTVADSQSAPVERAISHMDKKSPEAYQRALDESSEQLPGLEENEDSDAMESDEDALLFTLPRPATHPLGEVSSNIADLRTPAVHMKIHPPDADTIVPETSPSEAHLQKYGEIVSQTPPVLSADDGDDAFNLFTQDPDFNNILHSPSPQKRARSRPVRGSKISSNSKLTDNSTPTKRTRAVEAGDANADIASAEEQTLTETSRVNPGAASLDDTSEYVTAPTDLPSESLKCNVESIRTGETNILEEEAKSGISYKPKEANRPSQQLPTRSQQNEHASESGVHYISVEANDVGEDTNHGKLRSAKHRTISSSLAGTVIANRGLIADDIGGNSTQSENEQAVAGPNKLTSGDQFKGLSRGLRRLVAENNRSFPTLIPDNVTPTSFARKVTRSSGRASEKARSNDLEEPATPLLPKRRKSGIPKAAVAGLFNNMAFSVTYGSRNDEKERILRLIKQNGGRVLEQGFDQLFDMPASELSFSAKHLKPDDNSGGYNLVLTAEAQQTSFACVVADEHSRRVKFMQALALGLPCISGRWIEHCVSRGRILDWDAYLLAAGESSFLGGAIRNRNLQPYSATTANFAERVELRHKLLLGKNVLIVMGKGRAEGRKRPYLFLTQALGPSQVKRVRTNQEARKVLLEAESGEDEFNWLYVEDNEVEAEKAIFGITVAPAAARKRKRGSTSTDDSDFPGAPPKKVKIVSDEYVIQSLILGKLLEDE